LDIEQLNSFQSSFLLSCERDFKSDPTVAVHAVQTVIRAYCDVLTEYKTNSYLGGFQGPFKGSTPYWKQDLNYIENDHTPLPLPDIGNEIKYYIYSKFMPYNINKCLYHLSYSLMFCEDPIMLSHMLNNRPKDKPSEILLDFQIIVKKANGYWINCHLKRLKLLIDNICNVFKNAESKFLIGLIYRTIAPEGLINYCEEKYYELLKNVNIESLKSGCLKNFKKYDYSNGVCMCKTGPKTIFITIEKDGELHATEVPLKGTPIVAHFKPADCSECADKSLPFFFSLLGLTNIDFQALDIKTVAEIHMCGVLVSKESISIHKLNSVTIDSKVRFINSLPILSNIMTDLLKLNITNSIALLEQMHRDVCNNYFKRGYKNLDPKITSSKKKALFVIFCSIIGTYTNKKSKIPEHLKDFKLRSNEIEFIEKSRSLNHNPIDLDYIGTDFKKLSKVKRCTKFKADVIPVVHETIQIDPKIRQRFTKSLNVFIWANTEKVGEVKRFVKKVSPVGDDNQKLITHCEMTIPLVKVQFNDCLGKIYKADTESLITLLNRCAIWKKNVARGNRKNRYLKKTNAPLTMITELKDISDESLQAACPTKTALIMAKRIRSMLSGNPIPCTDIPKIYGLVKDKTNILKRESSIVVKSFYPETYPLILHQNKVNTEIKTREMRMRLETYTTDFYKLKSIIAPKLKKPERIIEELKFKVRNRKSRLAQEVTSSAFKINRRDLNKLNAEFGVKLVNLVMVKLAIGDDFKPDNTFEEYLASIE
jgi:hypothetical protein